MRRLEEEAKAMPFCCGAACQENNRESKLGSQGTYHNPRRMQAIYDVSGDPTSLFLTRGGRFAELQSPFDQPGRRRKRGGTPAPARSSVTPRERRS